MVKFILQIPKKDVEFSQLRDIRVMPCWARISVSVRAGLSAK